MLGRFMQYHRPVGGPVGTRKEGAGPETIARWVISREGGGRVAAEAVAVWEEGGGPRLGPTRPAGLTTTVPSGDGDRLPWGECTVSTTGTRVEAFGTVQASVREEGLPPW